MKRISISIGVVVGCLLAGISPALSQGFRGFVWKTTPKTVMAKEGKYESYYVDPITKELQYFYTRRVADHVAKVTFRFRDTRLVGGIYEFELWRDTATAQRISKDLVGKYGKPMKVKKSVTESSLGWKKKDLALGIVTEHGADDYTSIVTIVYYQPEYVKRMREEEKARQLNGL